MGTNPKCLVNAWLAMRKPFCTAWGTEWEKINQLRCIVGELSSLTFKNTPTIKGKKKKRHTPTPPLNIAVQARVGKQLL